MMDSITRASSEITSDRIGKRIILPSTHLGSDRHMHKLFQNSMTIVRFFGKPDLFITFTANPHWKEITEGGQSDTNRLITRVFNLKLLSLLQELKDGIFSTYKGLMRIIEFQKRGLPHCHILLFLDRDSKFTTPEQIDKAVFTEIPDSDQEPELSATVTRFMMHGPCGELNSKAPCMKMDKRTGKMKCSKGFPKAFQSETEVHDDEYPPYRRRDDGRQVARYVKGRDIVYLDNRWVVPYNPYLSLKYDAHINVEVCATIQSVKYIHKYIYKGSDRAIVEFSADNNEVDEIKQYLNARYIGLPEAIWRILSFDLHEEYPPVLALQIHLPNQQFVAFNAKTLSFDRLQRAASIKTTLMAFFDYNSQHTELFSISMISMTVILSLIL